MSRNPYDLGEVSRLMQKKLKKSKRKYDTFDILCTLKQFILDDFADANINIELDRTELLVSTNKKKNNKMKEIKNLIDDTLIDMVDKNDIDLLFEINASKSNICVKCKRKIEH